MAGIDERLQPLLLAHRIGGRKPGGVGHTQSGQRGDGAAQARFAGHGSLIHRRGEARRIGQPIKRLAPGALMRGCEEHAIDIEDRGGQQRD